MNVNLISESLEKAKQLINSGQVKSASQLLINLLKENPSNTKAWWLLSFSIEDEDKKLFALQQLAKLLPRNENVKNRISQISRQAKSVNLSLTDKNTKKEFVKRINPKNFAPLNSTLGQNWLLGLSFSFIILISVAFIIRNSRLTPNVEIEPAVISQSASNITVEKIADQNTSDDLGESEQANQLAAELPPTPSTAPTEVDQQNEEQAEALSEEDSSLNNDQPQEAPTAVPSSPEIQDLSGQPPEVIEIKPLFAASQNNRERPPFDVFVDSVINGNANQIVGVYVENRFSLRVVGQPANNPGWITGNPEETTDFEIVKKAVGNDGLIAHNYLAGNLYFDLRHGDIAQLIMGDGRVIDFEVVKIEEFQALVPNSAQSDFLSLDDGEHLSASELFYRVYGGSDTLTFQTCILNNNISTWGRIFIVGNDVY